MKPGFLLWLGIASCTWAKPSGSSLDELANKLLGVDEAQQATWARAEKAGALEVAPVHLPVDPPGDCNHYGWPVAAMAGDVIIVMHRRIPGHRAKGAGKPHPKMSYGIVLRSSDGGKAWSKPYVGICRMGFGQSAPWVSAAMVA